MYSLFGFLSFAGILAAGCFLEADFFGIFFIIQCDHHILWALPRSTVGVSSLAAVIEPANTDHMRQLLFLCTANHYRSRFAEMLFNHLAAESQLNWHADSRGIATILGADNTDVISEHTVNGLRTRGVGIGDNHRAPIQVQPQDFEQADLVIALDEDEHRPYMQRWFPDWADRIEYWQVGDLHITTADEALQMADAQVRALIHRLAPQ
jgi:protein-tyrosine phosphatase